MTTQKNTFTGHVVSVKVWEHNVSNLVRLTHMNGQRMAKKDLKTGEIVPSSKLVTFRTDFGQSGDLLNVGFAKGAIASVPADGVMKHQPGTRMVNGKPRKGDGFFGDENEPVHRLQGLSIDGIKVLVSGETEEVLTIDEAALSGEADFSGIEEIQLA